MTKQFHDIINYIRLSTKDIDMIRLNQILYYADYLSLEATGLPITWSKYHVLNNVPYSAVILAEVHSTIDFTSTITEVPTVPERVKNIISQVISEFNDIKRSFSGNGIDVFVSRICNMCGRPSVDHESMLYYITQEWDKKDRRAILTKYRTALANKKYYYTNEEGKLMNCTKYVAEYED